MKSFTLHDLPPFERPRERLIHHGAEHLSTVELLALVLGRGFRGESVMITAQKLLSRFGSLESILNASLSDLQNVKGLGLAKATQLKACLEIARRVSALSLDDLPVVVSAVDVYRLMRSRIAFEMKEHFVVLSFDVRHRFIGYDIIAVGILNSNIIHPRETFEAAIRRHASFIIVSHNHPSGVCDPSDEDIVVTKRLQDAGTIMGIHLIDHVIVSKSGYFSFAERGLV